MKKLRSSLIMDLMIVLVLSLSVFAASFFPGSPLKKSNIGSTILAPL